MGVDLVELEDTSLLNVKWTVRGKKCKNNLCGFEYKMLKEYLEGNKIGKILSAQKILN